ncbi:Putative metallopeptidase domain containing protein [uncultured Caudovirales phage]|uniref:Metallopeptidase domain containing protein n=1 Tax=uncultured Caudovirales phage TaxID=2100421 RepID=A0A6J5MLV3_9CAUD|nr:Putative metallopeptidase domain containing protein [uncultured Caudovirales phage]
MANIVPATNKEFDIDVDANRTQITEVALTPEQHRKYMEARTALLWAARFFAVIFYERASVIFTDDIPTLATDDRVILVNPTFFCDLTVGERVFVLCHEVLHMIYAHCQLGWEAKRQGHIRVINGATVLDPDMPAGCLPFNHMLMNIAQDFMINAALIECKVGTFRQGWLFNSQFNGSMSTVDIYRQLYELQQKNPKPQQGQPQQGQGQGQPQKGQGQPSPGKPGTKPGDDTGGVGDELTMPAGTVGKGRFDQHLKPGEGQGKDAREAAAERDADAGEWKLAVTKAAQAAKMAGQMPAGLERLINDIIQPQVDWRELIVGSFARSLGGGGYNWRRPDRDWINRAKRVYVPSRSGHGAGVVVIVGDTSGSMTDDEMQLVLGCVVGVLEEAKPQKIILMWCDAALHVDGEYDDAADLLTRAKPKGGGGTDFRPPFDWLEAEGIVPDTLLYVTDMQGRFPDREPSFPVIWGSISNILSAPFGDVVAIPR